MNNINAALIFDLVVGAYSGIQIGMVLFLLFKKYPEISLDPGSALAKLLFVGICFLIGMRTIEAFSSATRWALTFVGLKDTGPHLLSFMITGTVFGIFIPFIVSGLMSKKRKVGTI